MVGVAVDGAVGIAVAPGCGQTIRPLTWITTGAGCADPSWLSEQVRVSLGSFEPVAVSRGAVHRCSRVAVPARSDGEQQPAGLTSDPLLGGDTVGVRYPCPVSDGISAEAQRAGVLRCGGGGGSLRKPGRRGRRCPWGHQRRTRSRRVRSHTSAARHNAAGSWSGFDLVTVMAPPSSVSVMSPTSRATSSLRCNAPAKPMRGAARRITHDTSRPL